MVWKLVSKQSAGQTHYYNENGINPNTDSYGQMLTGQQVINGKHYRFDNQGNMIVAHRM